MYNDYSPASISDPVKIFLRHFVFERCEKKIVGRIMESSKYYAKGKNYRGFAYLSKGSDIDAKIYITMDYFLKYGFEH